MITFSVMIDTRAVSQQDKYIKITNVDQLCSFEFEPEVIKVGFEEYKNELAKELEDVNNDNKYACKSGGNALNSDDTCYTNRYLKYRELAQKCPGDVEKLCGACLDADYEQYAGYDQAKIPVDYQNCKTDTCKAYREVHSQPTCDVVVTDLESCQQACNSCGTKNSTDQAACLQKCVQNYVIDVPNVEDNTGSTNESGGVGIHIGTLTCEGISDITSLVGKIYRFGIVFLVAGLAILSMADYGKAVMSDNQDAMKKANKHLVTRIIIIAIYVFLPLLINMALHVFLPNIKTCLNF